MACRFLKRGAFFGFAQSHEATKMSCLPRSGFSLRRCGRRIVERKKGLPAQTALFVASWLCANK
jgi:hypothetical protein